MMEEMKDVSVRDALERTADLQPYHDQVFASPMPVVNEASTAMKDDSLTGKSLTATPMKDVSTLTSRWERENDTVKAPARKDASMKDTSKRSTNKMKDSSKRSSKKMKDSSKSSKRSKMTASKRTASTAKFDNRVVFLDDDNNDPSVPLRKKHRTRWKSDFFFPLRAFLCLPCALGDLMERIGFPIFGPGTPKWMTMPAWNAILFVIAVYLILLGALIAPLSHKCWNADPEQTETICEDWEKALLVMSHNLGILMVGFVLAVLMLTRYYLRRRDNIQTEMCPRRCPFVCEDFCCSLWCSTLVLIQMHRHVSDHDECRRQFQMEQHERRLIKKQLGADASHTMNTEDDKIQVISEDVGADLEIL